MQGWCTTRKAGIENDAEPTPTSGWGFCWNDTSQEACNEFVNDGKADPRAFRVSILNESLCVEQLEENLKVEQPAVQRSEFEHLQRAGLFCVARKEAENFANHKFYLSEDEGNDWYRAMTSLQAEAFKV